MTMTLLESETSSSPRQNVRKVAELYRRNYGYCRSVLQHLGVPPANVDDAVQDVFIVVHRRVADFEGRSSPRTWITGIARHVAAHYRRSSARFERRLDAYERTLPDVEPRECPEDFVARIEAESELQRFVEGLSADQRRVFELYTFEGKSGPEIAEELGLNPSTTYSRIRLVGERFERLCEAHAARHRRVAFDKRRAWMLPVAGWGFQGTTSAAVAKLAFASLAAVLLYGLGYWHGRTESERRGESQATVASESAYSVDDTTHPPVAEATSLASIEGRSNVERTDARASEAAGGPSPRGDHVEVEDATLTGRAEATSDARELSASESDVLELVAPELDATRVQSASPKQLPPARRASTPTEPHGIPKHATLAAELQLVAKMRRGIHAGEDLEVLALVEEHVAQFRDGALVREREAYRAIATCRALAKRDLAESFVRAHASSAMAARVEAACGLDRPRDLD